MARKSTSKFLGTFIKDLEFLVEILLYGVKSAYSSLVNDFSLQ